MATGSPSPAYQWQFNGEDIDAVDNPSAATATLNLSGLELSHSGSYRVIVSNHMDSVMSSVSTLTVAPGNVAPMITLDPQSQSACVGDMVVLTVAATGSPTPTWVWRKGTTEIPGESGPTLTLSSVDAADAGSYTAEAVNGSGSATSAAAVLTVDGPPTLDGAPPAFILVTKGTAVTLMADATGETSFEWKLGETVLGETGPTLTLAAVQPPNAGTYTVTAVNSCGRSASGTTQIAIKHISNAGFANGKFGFSLDGDPGDVWIFEFATDGDFGVWTEAGRVTLDVAGVPASATGTLIVSNGRVTDTASNTAPGSRVYRMRKE